jgi:hypothetical protein
MNKAFVALSITAAMFGITGCDTIAQKTNMLTDEKILAETSGTLGYQPKDLTIVSRRTEGTNTYVNLLATNKKEYTCLINGGNILTYGMINPPQCARKGDPIPAAHF